MYKHGHKARVLFIILHSFRFTVENVFGNLMYVYWVVMYLSQSPSFTRSTSFNPVYILHCLRLPSASPAMWMSPIIVGWRLKDMATPATSNVSGRMMSCVSFSFSLSQTCKCTLQSIWLLCGCLPIRPRKTPTYREQSIWRLPTNKSVLQFIQAKVIGKS